MPGNTTTTAAATMATTADAPTRWFPQGVMAHDWSDVSRALNLFANAARCEPGAFRTEAVAFRGNVYTVEFLPARGEDAATPAHARTKSSGDYPSVRVSVRTADHNSCQPADDFWPRFIGTLSRLLRRVVGRFDAARREAIGYQGLFESCERGFERYLRARLSTGIAMRRPAGDIEAVFSDQGAKQGAKRSVMQGSVRRSRGPVPFGRDGLRVA